MLAPENNGYHKQYMLAYEHTLAPELFQVPTNRGNCKANRRLSTRSLSTIRTCATIMQIWIFILCISEASAQIIGIPASRRDRL